MFRGVPRESETILEDQIEDWFTNVISNFLCAPWNMLKRYLEISNPGSKTSISRLLAKKIGMFRGGSQKSETTFLNQLLILFHKCGLRILRPPRNIIEPLKTPTTSPSWICFFSLYNCQKDSGFIPQDAEFSQKDPGFSHRDLGYTQHDSGFTQDSRLRQEISGFSSKTQGRVRRTQNSAQRI